jgi:DNA-binding transcriptional MerR regulator
MVEQKLESMAEDAEDTEVLDEIERDTVSTAEEIEAAKSLHWVDKPEFRGEGGAQWKTAHDFLEHGREVLPILRKNNDVLRGELAAERRERQRIESEMRAMGTSLKAIRDAQEEDQTANAEARKAELKAELAQAVKDQDGDRASELTEQLIQLGQQIATHKPNGKAAEEEVQRAAPALDPAVQAFVAENSWYVADAREAGQSGKDVRRSRLMNVIAAEMREAGDKRIGKPFLDAVKLEVDKTVDDRSTRRGTPNSVEAARGGGTGGGSGGKNGRYDELPAEAKRQCEADIKSLVGPGKRHKTPESYRKSYATLYFQE